MSTNVPRKELEAAPEREGWEGPSVYRSLYLLPSRKKHDSGYGLIIIVGRSADGSLEKAAWCDDICWRHQAHPHEYDYTMRTDMTYPGGIAHCWGWNTEFEIGASLSSTTVTVRYKKDEAKPKAGAAWIARGE